MLPSPLFPFVYGSPCAKLTILSKIPTPRSAQQNPSPFRAASPHAPDHLGVAPRQAQRHTLCRCRSLGIRTAGSMELRLGNCASLESRGLWGLRHDAPLGGRCLSAQPDEEKEEGGERGDCYLNHQAKDGG